MQSWSIARRINFGMGGGLVAIAVVGLASLVSIWLLTHAAGQYRDASRASFVSSELTEDVLEATVGIVQFKLSGSAADIEIVEENFADVPPLEVELRTLLPEDSAGMEQLDQISVQFDSLSFMFEEVVTLRAAIDDIASRIRASGAEAQDSISAIQKAATDASDGDAAEAAAEVSRSLAFSFGSLERFLATWDVTAKDAAEDYLAATQQALERLIANAEGPAITTNARAATTRMQALEEAFAQLRQSVLTASGFYDEIAFGIAEIDGALDALQTDIVKRQTAISATSQLRATIAMPIIALISLAGILVGGFIAYTTSKAIRSGIDEAVGTTTALADGKLDVEIVEDGQPEELQRISRALVVFRDNARKARELAVEAEAAAAREKKAAEEKARLEAAEREAAAERAAAERARDFQHEVAQVIDKAARGDFSVRLPKQAGSEERDALAQQINTLIANVNTGIEAITEVMGRLADGDLGGRMSGDFHGAFAKLQAEVDKTIAALEELIGGISSSSERLNATANELAGSADEIARRGEQNAATLEESSAALEELTASVNQVASNVKDAAELTTGTREKARSSETVAEEATSAIGQISEGSERIKKIVDVIADIAFQINLLALNAGVEAARAGEAGRGFSVVASEVRSLAQRSADAVEEITGIISESATAVESGVERVGRTREAFAEIVKAIVGVADQVDEISAAVEQQSVGLGEINSAVSNIDGSNQAVAASMEEIKAASLDLAQESKALVKAVSRFDAGGRAGGAQAAA